MLPVAFGLGFILGPAIGGLLGAYGTRLPFWVAAGLSLANAMYGLFVLPESLPPERRERFKWRRSNPLGSLDLLRSDAQLFQLAAVNFIGSIVHEALPTLFVIYAGYRYGWGTREAGLAIAIVGVCSAAVGGGLVKPLVARLGERTTMLLGLACGAIGFGLYGLAVTGLIFCIAIPVNSLWGLWGPPMQGIMTQRVKETEQGQLQGALGSIRGIGMLIGPGLFTASFAFAIARGGRLLAGTPFILAAILLFASIVVAWRATASTQTPNASEGAAAGS
jgi:DHA1 family tetracycline resistance protein-like MFS transporter